MKKISLVTVISLIICTTTVFAKDRTTPQKNTNPSSQSASSPVAQKKHSGINKWLFQKEPSRYSESYERGVYRVRDRK